MGQDFIWAVYTRLHLIANLLKSIKCICSFAAYEIVWVNKNPVKKINSCAVLKFSSIKSFETLAFGSRYCNF